MDVRQWINEVANYIDQSQWVFYRYCNCGGTPKYKYKWAAKGYELHVMPNRNYFRVFMNNGKPGVSGYIDSMKEKLETLNV